MRIIGLRKKTKIGLLCVIFLLVSFVVIYSVSSHNALEKSPIFTLSDWVGDVDIVVKVENGFSVQNLEQIDNIKNIQVQDDYIYIDMQQEEPTDKNLKDVADIPGVAYVEENGKFSICDTIPDDSYFGNGYNEQWGHYQIDAQTGWDTQTGSGTVVVAVLDTGLDLTHEDIASNLWANSGEIAGNGIDDDGNGYIDDVTGWDFVNNDNNPTDDHGHGSHVAGIIGADTDNATGVAGTIWDVQIMPLKMLNANGDGSLAGVIAALEYARDNGADIINMSWRGGSYYQSLQDTLTDVYTSGVIPIAAAGNDRGNVENWYPAAMNHVLTVGATDATDNRASFSNYGNKVEVAAPGVNILSLRASGTTIGTCSAHGDEHYKYCGGTSMATPFVSGVAALVLDQNAALTNEQVMQILAENADDFSSDYYLGRGRVNAHAAITNASITPGVISSFSSTVSVDNDNPTVGDTVTVTVTILDGDDTPLSGRTIYLESSRGGNDAIAPSETTSDALGQATFTLDSTTAGSLYVTAFDDNGTSGDISDDVIISFMPDITYDPDAMSQFGFSTVGNTQTQTSFSITVYAQDQYENTITSFGDTVNLSDRSGGLTVSQTGNFTDGVWSGTVRVDSYQLNNYLTATNGVNSGSSNTFNVTHPSATIYSVSPRYSYTSGSRYTQTMTLNGINFRSGATVKLTKSGQGDIVCSNVSVISSTKLTCNLNTNGKATRYWNVYIKNHGINTSSDTISNYVSLYRRADLNKDWGVDIFDFSQLLGEFNQTGNRISDINGDSTVDLLDFSAMLGQWVTSY